jgi:putative ABC transport system permease protein
MLLHEGSMVGDWTFGFRVAPGDVRKSEKIIVEILEERLPNDPFELKRYTDAFSQEKILLIYESLQKLIRVFSIMNVLLAIIGLLGLISFTLYRRTKEISIRKINGSSSLNIFALLNREHLLLLLLASLISWPAGYWLYMNFPGIYKFELRLWIFILPTVTVLGISVLATLFFNIKAALTNPAASLRYE